MIQFSGLKRVRIYFDLVVAEAARSAAVLLDEALRDSLRHVADRHLRAGRTVEFFDYMGEVFIDVTSNRNTYRVDDQMVYVERSRSTQWGNGFHNLETGEFMRDMMRLVKAYKDCTQDQFTANAFEFETTGVER